MAKKKLTLSVSGDLLEEVKLIARREGVSLSGIVEEYFEYFISAKWIDALAEELGLGVLEPTTEFEVPASRSIGLDSARIVRELRNSRAEAITRGGG